MSVFEQISQGTANTPANAWPVEVTDGTNILGTPAHPVKTDPTGTTTQPVSGTVAVSGVAGTVAVTESGTWTVRNQDGAGNTLTSTSSALDVNLKTSAATVTVAQATAANLNTTAVQGGTWTHRNQDGAGNALTSTSGALDSNLKTVGGSAVLTGTGASAAGVPRVTVSNDSAVKVWNGTNTLGIDSTGAATANITEVGGVPLTTGQKTMANSIPICIASDQNLAVTVGAVYNEQTGTTSSGAVPTSAGGVLTILSDNFLWSTMVLNFIPVGLSYGGIFEVQGSTDGVNWTALTGTLLSATPSQVTQYTTTSFVTCAARYNLAGFPYIRILTLQAFSGTLNVTYALTSALGDEVSFTKSLQVDASGNPVNATPNTQYVTGQMPLGSYYQAGSGSFTSVANDQISKAYVLPKPSQIGNTLVVALVMYPAPTGSVSVSDTAGNTYTQVLPASGDASLMVFTAPIYAVDSEGQVGFTVNTNSTSLNIVAHEYSGLSIVSPMDAASSNSGTATSGIQPITTPTITTTTEDIVFALLWGQQVTPSAALTATYLNFSGTTCTIDLASPYPTAASLPTQTLFQFTGLTGAAASLNGTMGQIATYNASTGVITFPGTLASVSYTGQNGTLVLGYPDAPYGLIEGFGFNPTAGTQRLNFAAAGLPGTYISTLDFVQGAPGTASTWQDFANPIEYQTCIVALKGAAKGTLAMGLNAGALKALATDASGNLNVNVLSMGSSTPIVAKIQDGSGNPIGSTSGALNVAIAGTTSISANPAASATGTAVPASASYTAFASPSNVLLGVSATNPLPVTVANTAAPQYEAGYTVGTPSGPMCMGTDGTDARALSTTTGGVLNVNVAGGSIQAGTQYTDGAGVAVSTGTVAMGFDGLDVHALHTTASGALNVNITGGMTTGTQYAAATAVSTPTGTVAMGWDGTDVRSLSTTATGALNVAGSFAASGVYNSSTPSLTTGSTTPLQTDASGSLKVNIAGGAFAPQVNLQSAGTALTNTAGALNVNVTNSAASATASAVPTSAGYTGFNSSGNLVGVSSANPLPVTVLSGGSSGTQYASGASSGTGTTGTVAMGTYGSGASTLALPLACDSSGTLLPAVQAQVTTSAPTYTTGKYGLLSLNTSGGLRVDGSGVTQPISGSVSVSGAVNLQSSGTALTNTSGSLNVNVTNSSGSSNAAASATGSAVPASAGYTGVVAPSGNLVGLPGYTDEGATGTSGTQVGVMGMMLQQAGGNYSWAERCDSNGSHIITPAPSTYAVCALSAQFINASGSAICIKNSAGNLYGLSLYSIATSPIFVQFFNVATAPTLGTSTVVFSVVIPASGSIVIPPHMALMNFSTGIGFAVTTAQNGASTSTAVTGMIFYK